LAVEPLDPTDIVVDLHGFAPEAVSGPLGSPPPAREELRSALCQRPQPGPPARLASIACECRSGWVCLTICRTRIRGCQGQIGARTRRRLGRGAGRDRDGQAVVIEADRSHEDSAALARTRMSPSAAAISAFPAARCRARSMRASPPEVGGGDDCRLVSFAVARPDPATGSASWSWVCLRHLNPLAGEDPGISQSSVIRIWRAFGLRPHLIESSSCPRTPSSSTRSATSSGYLKPPKGLLRRTCSCERRPAPVSVLCLRHYAKSSADRIQGPIVSEGKIRNRRTGPVGTRVSDCNQVPVTPAKKRDLASIPKRRGLRNGSFCSRICSRPTTTWTGPDRTTLSGQWPEQHIRRSEPFWLLRPHIHKGPTCPTFNPAGRVRDPGGPQCIDDVMP
jgi:hypothetical protein